MMALTEGPTAEALDPIDCWRALGEAVPDLLLIVDQQGTIRHANRASSSRNVDELIGASVLDLAPADRQAELAEALNELFATGAGIARELGVPRADGCVAWFAVHAGPVRQSSVVVASVIIARDITNHRTLEAHLHATQQLEALGHLMGHIAHDINNMLSVIAVTIGMLSERTIDEQTQMDLAAVLEAVRRGETLTAKLSRYAPRPGMPSTHQPRDFMLD